MVEVPPTAAAPSASTRVSFGHYDVVREIASGGMATVYLAQQRGGTGPSHLVAIKSCHPHLRRDPPFVTMFLDEARLAARIKHPNVVATLEIGDDEALYFVMQYVAGTNLADWIKHAAGLQQRVAEPLLLRVLLDTLNGLHAAHELCDETGKRLQLIHRDVSPQNLLIGRDGVTRIADFGIAKAESRATRTRTGQVKGKTGYMSPEQILGEPIDRRTDIYAAGVVMWEALAGQRLFDADSDAAIINQVLNARIAPPSTVSAADPALDEVVQRALQFEPAKRYATALEFASALEHAGLAIASHHDVGQAINDWLESPPNALGAPHGAEQRSLPAKRWIVVVIAALALAAAWHWLRHARQVAAPLPASSSIIASAPPSVASAVRVPPPNAPVATIAAPATAQTAAQVKITARQRHASGQRVNSVQAPPPAAPPLPAAAPTTPAANPPLPKSKPAEFRPPDL